MPHINQFEAKPLFHITMQNIQTFCHSLSMLTLISCFHVWHLPSRGEEDPDRTITHCDISLLTREVETQSFKTCRGVRWCTKCWRVACSRLVILLMGSTLPPLHPRCVVLPSLIKEVTFETEPVVAAELRLVSAGLLPPCGSITVPSLRSSPEYLVAVQMSDGLIMSCYCANRCIRVSPMISGHCKDNVSLIAWSMTHRRSRGGRCWVLSRVTKPTAVIVKLSQLLACIPSMTLASRRSLLFIRGWLGEKVYSCPSFMILTNKLWKLVVTSSPWYLSMWLTRTHKYTGKWLQLELHFGFWCFMFVFYGNI